MKIRDQLIQELDEARQKMREVAKLAGENTQIYGPWKMKEVLAHITGWDDATIAALHAHAQDDSPSTPADRGIDYYNAETVSTREELPYAHIVREWENTREQLRTVLLEMPDEKFDEPLVIPWGGLALVAQLVRVMSHHEMEHAEEIRALLSNNAPTTSLA